MHSESIQTDRGRSESDAMAAEVSTATAFVDRAEAYRGRDLPNAMTVDVEDYFQVSAFDGIVSRDDWAAMPQRLERNVERVLALFDNRSVKATFFTLGWVAEKYPGLIRRIVESGHELASHSCDHTRVSSLTKQQFSEDVSHSRKLLEDVSGSRVIGYRAPSFSITDACLWAHDILAEAGYRYSSSIYPISHDHYGLPSAPRFPFLTGGDLLEVPLATVSALGRNWPCAGGGYFRLLPFSYSRTTFRRINDTEKMPAVFYFHPWELDPDQPRVTEASRKARFRHYVNLDKFEGRLDRMLASFDWSRMDEIFIHGGG